MAFSILHYEVAFLFPQAFCITAKHLGILQMRFVSVFAKC